MDTLKTIIDRRSIRRFIDKDIPEEIINQILKAGMYAPSGGNAQPWDFVVTKNSIIIDALEKTSPYALPLSTATCAIVVCGNMDKEKFQGLWIQDCSAATQNILLAAHSLGIGTTWLGVYPEATRVDAVRQIIEAPKNITPLAIIALGYPGESKETPNRFVEKNIHHDKW